MNKLLLIVLVVGVFVVEVAVSAEVRERSDDGGPLEVVVEHLSQQVISLTAQLNSVNTQLNSVSSDLSALKTRTGKLPFSADVWLPTSLSGSFVYAPHLLNYLLQFTLMNYYYSHLMSCLLLCNLINCVLQFTFNELH